MSLDNFKDQSSFLASLHHRTVMVDGTVAGSSYLRLSSSDAKELKLIAERLALLANHETEIKLLASRR